MGSFMPLRTDMCAPPQRREFGKDENSLDSINANQLETNRENLVGADAIGKIKAVVSKTPSCFFSTSIATGDSGATRPMTVQRVDDRGSLWFLSPSDSHKNTELSSNPSVRLYFQSGEYSGFLVLNGIATVSRDRAKIEELWKPVLTTWFTEGIEDPRNTVIEVAPTDGYYWDTKHGVMVAGVKMLIGAAIGATLDDSIEGTLRI